LIVERKRKRVKVAILVDGSINNNKGLYMEYDRAFKQL
jgi:hypothetical protein